MLFFIMYRITLSINKELLSYQLKVQPNTLTLVALEPCTFCENQFEYVRRVT